MNQDRLRELVEAFASQEQVVAWGVELDFQTDKVDPRKGIRLGADGLSPGTIVRAQFVDTPGRGMSLNEFEDRAKTQPKKYAWWVTGPHSWDEYVDRIQLDRVNVSEIYPDGSNFLVNPSSQLRLQEGWQLKIIDRYRVVQGSDKDSVLVPQNLNTLYSGFRSEPPVVLYNLVPIRLDVMFGSGGKVPQSAA